MEYVKLNNGVEMPVMGIGTFMLSPIDAENSVREALKAGYKLIDTANAYANERAVGRGIKTSGVNRKEIFVSTKLWPTEYENESAIDETLERLGLDYVDLYLIHQPYNDYFGAWRALEELYEEGKVKAIGVDNLTEDRLADLIFYNKIKELNDEYIIIPQVNLGTIIEKKTKGYRNELFKNIDMPTVTVLADMQWNGMYADEEELNSFGNKLKEQLEIKTKII